MEAAVDTVQVLGTVPVPVTSAAVNGLRQQHGHRQPDLPPPGTGYGYRMVGRLTFDPATDRYTYPVPGTRYTVRTVRVPGTVPIHPWPSTLN